MKISVVIPTYNVEPYIVQAVESALAQTRVAHEIIVADDCSTDGTREVVRGLPVRLIELERNSGSAAARNRAIDAATGDVIAMLDGDDYWKPHHLETLAALLERHPEAVLAASATRIFGLRDHDMLPRFPAGPPRDVFDIAFQHVLVSHMAVLYRTDAVKRAGQYYEPDPIACDMDLWLRLSRVGPFVCTHEVTAFRRMHAAQISAVPYRQKLADLRHRRRCVDRIAAEGDAELATDLEWRLAAIWRTSIREAWQSRDAGLVRALLSARGLIRGVGARDALLWGAAARLVPVATATWDRIPRRRRPRQRVRRGVADSAAG